MKHLPRNLRSSEHVPTTRMRTAKRSSAGPLRAIKSVRAVRLGRGHAVVMTLECGHQVLHLNRRDLHVGGVTGCPHCE